jgi:hypothetical protein
MITLQIGQCGNQVGASLFQCMADEALKDGGDTSHRGLFNRHFRVPSSTEVLARVMLSLLFAAPLPKTMSVSHDTLVVVVVAGASGPGCADRHGTQGHPWLPRGRAGTRPLAL